jgi:lipopolysaccharide assembly outer membrane protein LptD (OstA)
MYRSLCVVSILFIFLGFFTTATWAETTQAKVTADEVKYDYESKQVDATGNVKIEYKDVKVESDYALIDQEQDILLATGKVIVHNKSDVYHGDRFLYYLKTQQGWVSPLDSEIVDSEINGPVRLTALKLLSRARNSELNIHRSLAVT